MYILGYIRLSSNIASSPDRCYPPGHHGFKKEKEELESETGTWIVKDVPRELMHRVKIAAAIQRKTLKQLLFDLAEAHLEELERKGMLPKGK